MFPQSGYDVGMHDPMSDKADIDSARSRYNARRTESSLIAWICSDVWKHPHYPTLPRLTGVSWSVKGSAKYDKSGIVSGEINAYTRDHVDGFATGEGL